MAEGETFGFLGPNGAGKTTTIRTLLDHIRPTSGRATIFGIETTADPVAIHRRLGYLPGEFVLYDRLTGGQTIEYFANLRGGVDPRYQADLIARLDIDPSRKFKEYSKGNKQKIGLVIALQHRPDLLMLDEPTSGLDPLVQQEFFTIIREAKAEGRTRLHVQPHPGRSRAAPRSGGDHPRRPAHPGRPRGGPARHRAPPGGAPLHRSGAGRRVRAPARRQRRGDHDHVLRMRVAGEITPIVKTAAHYELADFVSREPTLEETFLAEYGPHAGADAAEPAEARS